jgi:hypothetical protein
MPIRTSRVQKNVNKKLGAMSAEEFLLRNLNGLPVAGGRLAANQKVDRQTLISFLRNVQELDGKVSAARPKPRDRPIEGFAEALHSINQSLSRYELIPMLMPRFEENRMNWNLLWRNRDSLHPFLDFLNIKTILELAQQGRVSALKQCVNCERWLFARFSHQRFCGDSCKETFHRTNPEDKVRRREWARKNYWLHKTKNIK